MIRKLSNIILCIIIMCMMLQVVHSSGDVSIQNEGEVADTTEIGWFDNFKETTETELKDELGKQNVVAAISNTTLGMIYVTLEDGSCYRIPYDPELEGYLKITGVDVKVANFIDETAQLESKIMSDVRTTISVYSVLFFSMLGIIFYGVYKNRSKKAAVPAAPVTPIEIETKPDDIPSVRFDDVEGIEELKSDIIRVVDCLKNPDKYREMGARMTKGIILYGPPGTGKTLIAKAIAGEAGVPFFSAVGSDFVEKYVGIGAQRVRDLYKKARRMAPCIVFIDEIDAVASQRGRDDNTEKDQTINALLAELDGFKEVENIVTICATNRLDMLDSAFKRAGRFDLKLAVGLPDRNGRERILKIHCKNKKLSDDVNIELLSVKTAGFSGAELEALLNEAALLAADRDKPCIDNLDLDDAFFKIVMQGNKKPRDKVTKENRIVAWHEAGHTLATKLLTDDKVSSVTIIGSSSGAGGVTFRAPKEDNTLYSKKYLRNVIKIMYAGRAAEQLYFGDEDSITTGASQDIKQATSVILEYTALYGMGNVGMLDLTQFKHDLSEVTQEASELAKSLYSETLELLTENIDTLNELALTLLREETLDENQIDEVVYKHRVEQV